MDTGKPQRKIAILSESPADEAAIAVIAETVLQCRIIPFKPPLLKRPHGWPSVLKLLPLLCWFLNNRTDAEGLIVVVDADDSSLHPHAEDNRLRLIRTCLQQHLNQSGPHRSHTLPFAIGVAAPAIEAWLLAPRDPAINEHHWHQQQLPRDGKPLRREYKRRLYHTTSPALPLETKRMVAAAHELTPVLSAVAKRFPNGLQPMIDDLSAWPAPH